VGLFAEAPMMIMARKEFAARDFRELIAHVKANREKVTMASAGMGSVTHLCAMLFQKEVGVPVTVVQYKGGAPAAVDVRSGQVDLICDLPTTTSSQVRSGDLRAYALTAPQRLATLPDVPTAAEVGMPGLDISVWFGLYAPKGTPQPIVSRLNAALVAALADATVRARFTELSQDVFPRDQQTVEAHTALQKADSEKWWPIIKAANIKGE
jgi:tripartite-type tricarboxylate transporter receptor subunit TctC